MGLMGQGETSERGAEDRCIGKMFAVEADPRECVDGEAVRPGGEHQGKATGRRVDLPSALDLCPELVRFRASASRERSRPPRMLTHDAVVRGALFGKPLRHV